jgi:hypothetical protein
MKRMIIAAGVTALAFGLSAPAQALTYVATYTGYISGGADFVGLFGTPDSLAGQSFTAVYTYVDYDWTMTAKLTIKGQSYDFSGNVVQEAYAYNFFPTGGADMMRHYVYDYDGSNSAYMSLGVTNDTTGFPIPSSLAGPWEYTPTGADDASGTFQIAGPDHSYAVGGLVTTHISLTSFTPDAGGGTGDVPEPTSWMLMLSGFGAIGVAMRSRRKPVVRFG